VSLSQEPAFSALQEHFVCGVRDITNEPYAGLSGRHEVTGNAVNTTNGAGPHNLQLFMLSSDGTVLECLPGFWNPTDLVEEMKFASQLNQVWLDPSLSASQKNQQFRQMQLSHIDQHSPQMVRRSKMQGFDQKWEAEHRLNTSDTIANRNLITPNMLQPGGKLPQAAFKTTDELMHERMAVRPFLPIQNFDVAAYVEYGKPKYDKHEDARNSDGSVNKEVAKALPTMGNQNVLAQERMQNRMRRRGMMGGNMNGGMNGWGGNNISNYPNNTYGQGYQTRSSGNGQNSVRNY
jgi:hypothetical protein